MVILVLRRRQAVFDSRETIKACTKPVIVENKTYLLFVRKCQGLLICTNAQCNVKTPPPTGSKPNVISSMNIKCKGPTCQSNTVYTPCDGSVGFWVVILDTVLYGMVKVNKMHCMEAHNTFRKAHLDDHDMLTLANQVDENETLNSRNLLNTSYDPDSTFMDHAQFANIDKIARLMRNGKQS